MKAHRGFESHPVRQNFLANGLPLMTKRKPATMLGILTEDLMAPFGMTQLALTEATGPPCKHVNGLAQRSRIERIRPLKSKA